MLIGPQGLGYSKMYMLKQGLGLVLRHGSVDASSIH